MNRRHFLQTALPAVATFAVGQAAKRPNILLAIADDWAWPFASALGDRTAKTPNFDRIAREGVLFTHAHAVSPSCTPSRGALLTGQWFARLEDGANLWSTLPAHLGVYPDILQSHGYHIGCTGKGWGPGDWGVSGRKHNPAGPEFNEQKNTPPATGISREDYAANFEEFLGKRSKGQPFCFWYGGHEPHRVYEEGSGLKAGKHSEDVNVPSCLADATEVRSDLLDYALEVEWFDTHLGRMLAMLAKAGELDNTLIAVTGDNGIPFPRCKTNLYDCGTHIPLAIRWGASITPKRTVEDFVALSDLAPTFLEAAGVAIPSEMTARSLMTVLRSGKSGWVDPKRDRVITGRERHTPAQPEGQAGYPMRAIRTRDFLYVHNYEPDRYPAGSGAPGAAAYKDIDNGPSKRYMIAHKSDASVANLFELGFGKRPSEELYDLRTDPAEQRNIATDEKYAGRKAELRNALQVQLKQWDDPRESGAEIRFDRYPYRGGKQAAAQ